MNRLWLWAREIHWLAVLAVLLLVAATVVGIVGVLVTSLYVLMFAVVLGIVAYGLTGLDNRR